MELFKLTFFSIKVAAVPMIFFMCSFASGIGCSVQKTPPVENPAASKKPTQISKLKFWKIFQLLIYSYLHNFSSSSSALHSHFFFNTLHFTNCASVVPASTGVPRTYPSLLFWIAKNIVFHSCNSVYRAYSPAEKKNDTFNQSELPIYVT